MASAGVVGMAEVITPNSAIGSSRRLNGSSPALWSFVWVGFAVLILLFIHVAAVGRR